MQSGWCAGDGAADGIWHSPAFTHKVEKWWMATAGEIANLACMAVSRGHRALTFEFSSGP